MLLTAAETVVEAKSNTWSDNTITLLPQQMQGRMQKQKVLHYWISQHASPRSVSEVADTC